MAFVRFVAVVLCVSICSGCALHFHDKASGKTHVVGLGLITYRTTQQEDRIAVLTQDRTLGVGAGASEHRVWAIVGYDNRTQAHVLDSDTCLRIEWPSAALINVDVGSRTPADWEAGTGGGGIACPPGQTAKPQEKPQEVVRQP